MDFKVRAVAEPAVAVRAADLLFHIVEFLVACEAALAVKLPRALPAAVERFVGAVRQLVGLESTLHRKTLVAHHAEEL